MVSVDALMEQHHADLVTLVKRKYEATGKTFLSRDEPSQKFEASFF